MKPTLVIHGGAIFGSEDFDPAKKADYKEALSEALEKGNAKLSEGKFSLDAIEASIHVLEDCGLFDAGRGSVYTEDGIQELDASIMNGKDLKAGAVAGVHTIKHPISAARKVMEETWHVMLIGTGAEQFASENGLEIVDPSYFQNDFRWNQYLNLKKQLEEERNAKKHSTVGAVALDIHGNLAAGTSTGGLEMKKYGRIGDSPIIGSGTYADNSTCAISATGEGEYFIRLSATFDIHAQMKYAQKSLGDSTKETLANIEKLGGLGGVIAIDSKGNIEMPYTSEGMFRGYSQDGQKHVYFYEEEV